MKPWSDHTLVRQWQQISSARRVLLQVGLWACGLLVIHQLLWLPGQARLQQAERNLVAEYEQGANLRRLMQGPPRSDGATPRLTPATLIERAKAAGIRINSLQAKAGQLDVSLEGPATQVLPWLHQLERDGGRVRGIQLQAQGELLHARLVLELADI